MTAGQFTCRQRFGSLALMLLIASGASAAGLSEAQRLEAQAAIERVYDAHRLWPRENSGPKPSFESVMPRSALEARVADTLAKSEVLRSRWNQPITPAMLQAEMDRMARSTQDSALLRELFAALDNDPGVIAETLARQELVDRLIHGRYASDARLHRAARSQAERALTAAATANWEALGGIHVRQSFVRATDARRRLDADPARPQAALDDATFDAQVADFDAAGDSPRWRETDEAFVVSRRRRSGEGVLDIESLSFPKPSFSTWWESVRSEYVNAARHVIDRSAITPRSNYSLPPITPSAAGGCDQWLDSGRIDPVADPRADHTVIWTGTEMIVWGGQGIHGGESGNLDSGGRYNPATDSWSFTTRGAGTPSPRRWHTAIWTGSEMIVWGGYDSSGNPVQSGGRYSPASDTWTPTDTADADLPSKRYHHAAVWTGSEMIIWGGTDDITGLTNTGGRYSPITDSWVATDTTSSGLPSARYYYLTAIWTGSEMIIWGGWDAGGCTNTGGRYDPVSDTWIATDTLDPDLPLGRYNHSAIWTGTEMIVWGGQDCIGGYQNGGGKYHPASDSWTTTNTTDPDLPAARYAHTAVWTGSEMIVWGGYDIAIGYSYTGGRYSPSADTWQPTSLTDVPTGRYYHSAVWTGSEMIVWGGALGTYFDSGGRYQPTSDTWTPTSTGDRPAARYEHTAVWTGTEMIIWGGWGLSGYLASGARYRPATNSWQATDESDPGLPTARYLHTAIWTGSEMIVWGGYDGFGYSNSGGRYQPGSDSWAGTDGSDPDLPTGRYYHTAVWSGTEMIIWGGYDSSFGHTNTGGRYAPASDSWSDTSPTDPELPSPRYYHSAIWTGTEMIVWGGSTGAAPFNTGGRYNPSSGDWIATDTADPQTPSSRDQHSAVWTGTGMIVWGGYDFMTVGRLDTGSVYDPGANAWSAVSTTDAPEARLKHAAVWTGDQMIVWGGDVAFSPKSGGRYDPILDDWTALPLTDAPGPRYDFASVWTGSELMVWGGIWSGYLNTGGRYLIGKNPSPAAIAAVDADTCANTGVTVTWPADATDWGDSETGIRGYVVLRDGSPVSSSLVYGTVSFTDTTGADNTDYTYSVRYTNGCGFAGDSGGGVANDRVPAAPTGLANNAASDANLCSVTGNTVSWSAPSSWNDNGIGTRTFVVLRGGSPLASGPCSGPLSEPTLTCTDSTAVVNTAYVYAVRAVNGCAVSSTTAGTSATDLTTSSPSGLANNTAADASLCAFTGNSINWSAPSAWNDNGSGSRTFVVLRDGNPIVSGPCSGSLSAVTTTCTDSTAAQNTAHSYSVRAVNGCGSTATTAGAAATDLSTSAPSGLANNTAADASLCAFTGNSVNWSAPSAWNDNGSGSRTFVVLRDGNPIANGPCSGSLSGGTTTCTDSTAAQNTAHSYSVQAVNGCGTSSTTAGASATDTQDTTAPTMTTVTIVKNAPNLDLAWTTAASAVQYKVYSAATPNPGVWDLRETTSATSWSSPTDLGAAGTIYYTVTALDACGNESPPN